jgi:hypothetical protein
MTQTGLAAPWIRRTGAVEYSGRSGYPASLRLDARKLAHLAPILGLRSDEDSEVGG